MLILREMRPILEVRGIGKKFRIQRKSAGYLSLRERMVNAMKFDRSTVEDFWALKDVSFDVQPGESVGIIGRNGAGKSTLLKILSKITPPTTGKILSRGRIASLLEVGTGFHPELTGRENIFFNGSLLGMKRREIEGKFDEIVDFSGVEKFLDTPLKHYSSGMQLRLAFAVAAFLEPEVLIIDEVLAVGDAEFQKKCIGKMEDVSRSGRTLLFVSHNLGAIQNLCTRALLLQNGQLAAEGDSRKVLSAYLHSQEQAQAGDAVRQINPPGSAQPVRSLEMRCDQQPSATAYMGCRWEVRLQFESAEPLTSPVLGVIIRDSLGTPLLGVNNKNYQLPWQQTMKSGTVSMTIPELPLFAGIYHVDVHFGNEFNDLEVIPDALQFTVDPLAFAKGEFPHTQINRIFVRDMTWHLQPISS